MKRLAVSVALFATIVLVAAPAFAQYSSRTSPPDTSYDTCVHTCLQSKCPRNLRPHDFALCGQRFGRGCYDGCGTRPRGRAGVWR